MMSVTKTSVRLLVKTPRPANNSGRKPAVTIASARADKVGLTSQQNAKG
jgi:hypothetical protein